MSEGERSRRYSWRGDSQCADALAAKGEEREGHLYRSEQQVLSLRQEPELRTSEPRAPWLMPKGVAETCRGGKMVKSR